MKDDVAVDTIAQVRLVKDDVQGRVVRAVRHLQTLIYVLVHNDEYTKDEYKDYGNRDNAIVVLIQHYKGFFLRRFTIRPFV